MTLANVGLHTYTPEMGEKKPIAQMEASLSHYGKHYFLYTPLELKGRGITFERKLEAKNLYLKAQYKSGWNVYKVTLKAFETLKTKYAISMECLLD